MKLQGRASDAPTALRDGDDVSDGQQAFDAASSASLCCSKKPFEQGGGTHALTDHPRIFGMSSPSLLW